MEKSNKINEKDSFLPNDSGGTPEPGDGEFIKKDETIKCCGKDTTLTRSQIVTLVLITMYFFLASAYYALFAPFLPGNALKKGVSQTQVGMMFGIYQLVIFIFSPIFGKYIEKIGVRILFVYGLLITSVGQIAFGFTDLFENKWMYFMYALVTRAIAGIGVSMGCSYGIAGIYFPNHISTVIAMLELSNGLGLTLGPPLGGLMYELGGFQFPFWCVGGFVFVLFVCSFFLFPQAVKSTNKEEINEKGKTLSMLPLFKIPKYFLIAILLMSTSLSLGFLGPSIQIHFKSLDLSPTKLGLLLFISPFLYAIASPIVGFVSDRKPGARKVILAVSGCTCALATSFIGPIPFYHLPLKLWIVICAFVLFGMALGGAVIPVYAELSSLAIENGYKNDIKLQGLISGTFNTFWALGALIGPFLGGFVVDEIGFPYSSLVIVSMFGLSSIFYLVAQIVCRSKKQPNKQIA